MVRCTSRTYSTAGQRRPANNEKSSEFAYFTIYYACVDDGKCDWSCWTNPIAPSHHSIPSSPRSMPSRHYDKGFARPTFVFYTANGGHVSSVRIYLFSGAALLGECVEDWHISGAMCIYTNEIITENAKRPEEKILRTSENDSRIYKHTHASQIAYRRKSSSVCLTILWIIIIINKIYRRISGRYTRIIAYLCCIWRLCVCGCESVCCVMERLTITLFEFIHVQCLDSKVHSVRFDQRTIMAHEVKFERENVQKKRR